MTEEYQYKFSGIGRLYGMPALEKLQASHVTVVGLGGVGSWVVEALARSGLGAFTLMDFDDVCMSNFNRQIHSVEGAVGKMKTHMMRERILSINPEARVSLIEDMYTEENQSVVFENQPHIIVDAIDSATEKCILISQCRKHKMPMLTIGGAGGLIDPTKIQTTDLSKSYADPLLKQVRRKLRCEYGFTQFEKKKLHIPSVFSTELPVYPTPEGGVCKDKPSHLLRALDCSSGMGTASHVTGAFGFVAANSVINTLLN